MISLKQLKEFWAVVVLVGGVAATLVLMTESGPPPHRYRHPLVGTRNLDEERAFYEEKVRRQPDSALERTALAALLMKMGRAKADNSLIDDAEKMAETSLKSLPFDNDGAKLVMAEVAEARHQFEKAIAIAKDVLKTNPKSEGALSILVTCHLGHGDNEEAHVYADKLVDLKPGLMTHTLRALVWLAKGHEARAIQDFNHALRLEDIAEVSSSAWTRTLIGRHYLSRGNHQMAERYLEEAIRIQGRNHLAIKLLGDLEVERGNPKRAETFYTEAYNLSGEPPYLLAHARLKETMGQKEEAEAMRKKAEDSIREEFASGPYGHANELIMLQLDRGGKEAVAEALAVATADVSHRHDAPTLILYMRALVASQKYEEALEVAGRLRRSGYEDPHVLLLTADVHRKLGQRSRADAETARAMDLHPGLRALKRSHSSIVTASYQ